MGIPGEAKNFDWDPLWGSSRSINTTRSISLSAGSIRLNLGLPAGSSDAVSKLDGAGDGAMTWVPGQSKLNNKSGTVVSKRSVLRYSVLISILGRHDDRGRGPFSRKVAKY